jgi:hypothetical protein
MLGLCTDVPHVATAFETHYLKSSVFATAPQFETAIGVI